MHEQITTFTSSTSVPNVPCGVERFITQTPRSLPAKFLMYRVELKVMSLRSNNLFLMFVPNVPCGVESTTIERTTHSVQSFLMYRVELKAFSSSK